MPYNIQHSVAYTGGSSMLALKHIIKDYTTGNECVRALKGVQLTFRDCEFVSILGQSGCGKTTLLNIIGGLDQYSEGDLIINGKSTKDFKDKDWDTYRNHSIGFVFQSYNLIPHQSVLSNVELALTLSGVSKEERRKRTLEVLTKVGLQDQVHKKPNQMSGGQMQRVAIARALVNNPDILLADEPTGALDSTTSVQIMALLKEIASDKLVIMVTHNPQLADEYSTRIIQLLDGEVVSDSNAMEDEVMQVSSMGKLKKTSMSFLTALSLSLHNLFTKKGRTMLTAFAGSIGIIGIALILSLSNGVQNYINQVEEDTLSSYPITLEDASLDMSVMMEALMGIQSKDTFPPIEGSVQSTPLMNDVLETMSNKQSSNNLGAFKTYLEVNEERIAPLSNGIQYGYNLSLDIYHEGEDIVQVNPNQILNELGFGEMVEMQSMMGTTAIASNEIWQELMEDQELLDQQYDVLQGRMPRTYDEVVLQVDEQNNISDYTLYSLGLMDRKELLDNFNAMMDGKEMKSIEQVVYSYDELLELKFKILLNTDYYTKENGVWVDKKQDEAYMKQVVAEAKELRVVGIVKSTNAAGGTSLTGGIGYTSGLQEYVISQIQAADIAKEQLANPEVNVFTNMEFPQQTNQEFDVNSLSNEQKIQMASMNEQQLAQMMSTYQKNAKATYESNLETLGIIDMNEPSTINIFAKDFDSKEALVNIIDEYNMQQQAQGIDENAITYSDMIGTMMSSVTAIIDVVSYVLMAFVGVSLLVSSIMIGIITYISVLERTKEIGVLRSIGASKRDISRVFNAETFIVGSFSGILGIVITILINLPVNYIIEGELGIAKIASLPWQGAILLILISMVLTVLAGLIPAKIASKKDPVVALRSE